MKKICGFLFILMMFCNTALASIVFDETLEKDSYGLHKTIKDTCDLFSMYGYSMDRNVVVHLMPNGKAFKEILIKTGRTKEQAEKIYEYSSAFTCKTDIYLVPNDVSNDELQRELSHEIVHQYQYQELFYDKNAKNCIFMLEGFADWISYNLYNYQCEVCDKRIKPSEINTFNNFHNAIRNYGANDVYIQCQYSTLSLMNTIDTIDSIYNPKAFDVFLKAIKKAEAING